MILSILASALALTATQSAAEFEDACSAYQAEYGGGADCSCLAEKVAEDEDLAAMMLEIQTPDDLANAPEEVIEAIEDCS